MGSGGVGLASINHCTEGFVSMVSDDNDGTSFEAWRRDWEQALGVSAISCNVHICSEKTEFLTAQQAQEMM
jgi:hypothetical protein